MTRFATFALALTAPLAVIAGPAVAQTAPEIAGEWHGTIAAPTGDSMLVLHVKRSADGALEAGLEARDQAPGRQAPVSEIAVAGGRLSFKVPALRASYEGTWDEAAQQWRGALTQSGPSALNFSRGMPPAKPRFDELDGLWEGSVDSNGVKLRQVLRIASGEWGTNALFDAPDQQLANLPLADLVREGRAVRFSMVRGAARFEGALSADGASLAGVWKAAGQPDQAVTFARIQTVAERAPPNRPQHPVAPYPYEAEEVAFDNPAAPGVRLAGTLTLPEGAGPFPVAIMVSGSGQHDRDETLDGHKPFWVIADHLTRNGIAVLRFDDRGAGQSTGDPRTATPDDKASDANAAFAYLAGRPEIRADAIGFIGHSEGGLIAPIAMASNDQAAFLVSLAGVADDVLDAMLAQLGLVLPMEGRSAAQVAGFQKVFAAVFKAVGATETPEQARAAALAQLTPEAKAALGLPPEADGAAVLREWAGPRVRYLAKYDPAPNLARIDVPVLALNGSLDLQVEPERNLAAFREALKDNPDVTVLELPGLNHMFQTATTGARGEYRDIEETFAPSALALISEWIRERFAQR